MIWYLEDVGRLRREREALEALALSVSWLTPIAWRFDQNVRLCVDIDIIVNGRCRPATLQYSHHFPNAPCLVLPRGDKTRWSSHQWGAGGELCLEYGTDNWVPSITGAHMLQSAYRLLQSEDAPTEDRVPVASRHDTTVGQDLRQSYGRLLVTRDFEQLVQGIPVGVPLSCRVRLLMHDECAVQVIGELTLPDATVWQDTSLPSILKTESIEQEAIVVKLPDFELRAGTRDDFSARFAALGLPLGETRYVTIVRSSGIDHFYLSRDSNCAIKLAVVPAQAIARRTDAAYVSLKGRKVAIVGCGSIGSKLSVMLARCGVGEFLLVDDDVVLPDNFARHDLDWRDVGTHKADGVARRIQLVSPYTRCSVRRHKLGGQESSGSLDSLLSSLATYDLIVDATAEARVFNLLSAAVASGRKPLLWAQVFAGGIGGLIARHRPDVEPAPQYMRQAIDNWFAVHGKPMIGEPMDYAVQRDGDPMIADDADVTAIAAHAARLAIDTLVQRTPSAFPNSVYLVGLSEGSVFSQPFETYPIEVRPAPAEPASPIMAPEDSAAEIMTLAQSIQRQRDGTAIAAASGEATAP